MSPKPTTKRRAADTKRPAKNMLRTLGVDQIDYKDTATLRLFISERGKIRSRTVTGLTVQQQHQVAVAIKNAREMALIAYPSQR
jgi:small subunit ribosomal protein S18